MTGGNEMTGTEWKERKIEFHKHKPRLFWNLTILNDDYDNYVADTCLYKITHL